MSFPDAFSVREGALWVQIKEMSLLAGKQLQRFAWPLSKMWRNTTSTMAPPLSLNFFGLIFCR